MWYLIVSIPDLCTLTYSGVVVFGHAQRGRTVGLLCSDIQLYTLLSHYLCFISFLYLDLYVLGHDASISQGSFMQTKTSMCLGPLQN